MLSRVNLSIGLYARNFTWYCMCILYASFVRRVFLIWAHAPSCTKHELHAPGSYAERAHAAVPMVAWILPNLTKHQCLHHFCSGLCASTTLACMCACSETVTPRHLHVYTTRHTTAAYTSAAQLVWQHMEAGLAKEGEEEGEQTAASISRKAEEEAFLRGGSDDYPSEPASSIQGVHSSNIVSVKLVPGEDAVITGAGECGQLGGNHEGRVL